MRLDIIAGPATLLLPVRPPRAEDAALPPFGPPEISPAELRHVIRPDSHARKVIRDNRVGETCFEIADDDGRVRIDAINLEVASTRLHRFHIRDADPLSGWRRRCGRRRWDAATGRCGRARASS